MGWRRTVSATVLPGAVEHAEGGTVDDKVPSAIDGQVRRLQGDGGDRGSVAEVGGELPRPLRCPVGDGQRGHSLLQQDVGHRTRRTPGTQKQGTLPRGVELAILPKSAQEPCRIGVVALQEAVAVDDEVDRTHPLRGL